MRRLPSLVCAALLGLSVLAPEVMWPQEPGSPAGKKATVAEIFSGTITKLTEDSFLVVRKVPGHDAVTREFKQDTHTKVEGSLREGARVTVRYKAAEDGRWLAVYVLVR